MNDDIVEQLRQAFQQAEESIGPGAPVELLDAAEEIERLQRWKAEATEVLGEWEKVWKALDQPDLLGISKPRAVYQALGLEGEEFIAVSAEEQFTEEDAALDF